jgi:F-type H+-transporting ATPase subunit delta
MRDRKLAVRYARALLSVFPDPRTAAPTEEFLVGLSAAMNEISDFRDLMLDPAVSRAQRRDVIANIVREAGLPAEIDNFMALLIDNNRAAAIPSIAEVFREEREAAMGIVPAELTTARPLTEEMVDRARNAMEKKTGRRVRLTCHVEPDLIGGAVTQIGSQIYDGSLRTQLRQLRSTMAEE